MADLEAVREIKKIPEFADCTRQQRQFLVAYSQSLHIGHAAELVGCHPMNHYNWMRLHDWYPPAFNKAKEIAADYAEGDVYERAFIGEHVSKERITKQGEVIKEDYKKKSDILAIFALKGLKPQYRDNHVSHGSIGPVNVQIVVNTPAALSINQTKLVAEENNVD